MAAADRAPADGAATTGSAAHSVAAATAGVRSTADEQCLGRLHKQGARGFCGAVRDPFAARRGLERGLVY